MKNIIKKITAAAMAFTLLGTGTAITKTIAPQLDNSITVHAGYNCSHVVGQSSYGKWETETKRLGWIFSTDYRKTYRQKVYCTKCGAVLWTNCHSEDYHYSTIYTAAGTSIQVCDIDNYKYWTE